MGVALTPDGFSASILRRTVVEFASPPLDQPPSLPFSFTRATTPIPDLVLARVETTSHWEKKDGEITEVSVAEEVDRLLKFVPNSSGAKW